MSKFDEIRPFDDHEVRDALLSVARHPMMKALMSFTFPDRAEDFWTDQFSNVASINDFQRKFISQTVHQILKRSSEGLTTSGFEKLDSDTAYLYISNHRDIVLDTSLLNLSLLENDLIMTSSAIGDNLVKKPFLHILAKLNRNFLVQRGLSIRDQLSSSKKLSEYIFTLLTEENRSVWMAQREGRTKDGNDATQQGVLKMLAMAAGDLPLSDFFRKLKIVPVSISYEYDPTDVLKMPQLMAKARNEIYIKDEKEDFTTMLSGVLGQKKHIHLHAGKVIDAELNGLEDSYDSKNKQLQAIAEIIDNSILQHYRLWPTNFIAYDMLYETGRYASQYTQAERQLFERRLEMRIDVNDKTLRESFLSMYANPVINKIIHSQKISI